MSTALPAAAQSGGTSSVEPGKIEDRIQKPAAQPTPERAPNIPDIPAVYEQIDGADQKVVLAGVQIEGASVYPIADFAPFYEKYLATEIKVSEIKAMVEAITAKYRAAGYFLARAIAEPQDLALGILKIRIVEGAIAKVTLNGEVDGRADLLQQFANKIKAARPAQLDRLERYMMLIDDLPGGSVQGSLQPIDEDKGEYELVLAVKHKLVNGYTSIDNRGTRAIGKYQALLNGNFNTGFSDSERTGLTIFTIPRSPKELAYAELTHEQFIGTEGLRAWGAVSHSEIDAGGTFSESDLGSRSSRVVLGMSYPFIRSRDENFIVNAKLDLANQRQDINDARDFDDRLRLLRLGASYTLNDELGGQNTLSAEYTRGFDVLGASDGQFSGQSRAPSRTDGHVEFSKLTAFASRRQKMGDKWAVQLSLSGQKSDERLLSAEEFYIGGTQFGRAFDSGEISGDDGAAASAELQYGQFLSLPYLDSYQLYGYYDFGIVWETAATDFNGRTTLSSAGGGVRLGFTKSMFGGVEVAKPLNRVVSNEGDKGPRVFFYLLASN